MFGPIKKQDSSVPAQASVPSWKSRLEKATGKPVEPAKPTRTLYLLIDFSGSMDDYGKLEDAKKGALRFCSDAQAKQYSVGVIAFSSAPVCLVEAKSGCDLSSLLYGIPASGSTNLTDALKMAAEKLNGRRGHKAICVVTDGMPDDRPSALNAALSLQAAGVEIMAIGTDDADKSFLDQLVTSKELSVKVPRQQLQQGVANMALLLPG